MGKECLHFFVPIIFLIIKIVHPVGDFLFELPMITTRGNTSLVLLWLWFCYFQHLMCHSWMIWMSWRCIWTLRVIHSQAVKSLHTVLRQICFSIILWIMGAYKIKNSLISFIKSCSQLGCIYIERKRTQKPHCFLMYSQETQSTIHIDWHQRSKKIFAFLFAFTHYEMHP